MAKTDSIRPTDSLFTHLFARSVSVHITPIIAKTIITPMQVTIAGLIFGLFAAWVGSNQGWFYCLSAALLMKLSHISDCVDGELARLTGRGNSFAACMDPISDRIKDMAVIFAACLYSLQLKVFNLSGFEIFSIAFFTISFWLFYLYIVDAFLNPVKIKKADKESIGKTKIYLGLYDLFIYGSIIFWISNIFEYFIFYIFIISVVGILIQLIKLKANLK